MCSVVCVCGVATHHVNRVDTSSLASRHNNDDCRKGETWNNKQTSKEVVS